MLWRRTILLRFAINIAPLFVLDGCRWRHWVVCWRCLAIAFFAQYALFLGCGKTPRVIHISPDFRHAARRFRFELASA